MAGNCIELKDYRQLVAVSSLVHRADWPSFLTCLTENYFSNYNTSESSNNEALKKTIISYLKQYLVNKMVLGHQSHPVEWAALPCS